MKYQKLHQLLNNGFLLAKLNLFDVKSFFEKL